MNKAQKIVIVSLHKTGTTTVSKFLEKLGFLVTGPDTHLFYEVGAENFNTVDVFLERYEVFQDDPWYLLYPYILEKYPNSKFIFLEREAQSWLSSMQRFYGTDRYNNKVRRLFYGNANTLEHADSYLKKYTSHNMAVFDYF